MRLDSFLHDNGYATSRTEAKAFVLEGLVTVNGKVVNKPSFDVSAEAQISVDKTSHRFVSRGGYKLEGALNSFSVDPTGRDCLDIGASSGGFTDCLLQRGAKRVIAVDSGTAQLVDSLRCDPRITVMEQCNARYLSAEDLEYIPTLTVMDVSFISATYIFEAIRSCMANGGDFICLIKPQFEVGKEGLGKGGIVKDDKHRKRAVDKVVAAASNFGFKLLGLIDSPILGGDGNREFLAHFKLDVGDGV